MRAVLLLRLLILSLGVGCFELYSDETEGADLSTPIYDNEAEYLPEPHPVDEDSCPRSREEAAAKGRQCLRKCKSDADCISNRKRCLCDGMCGWSCVRPDLHCDELPAIENGFFKLNGDFFGARVVYGCKEGFWMSGTRERVCQGDASWSDAAPDCKKKAVCGNPPQVPHARHTAQMDKDDFDIDDMVQYNCFPGYDSKGFPEAKCMFYNGTAQWFGPDLKCIPRSCGHPGEVEHGRREGAIFTFTSRVTYHCLDGYELVGRANRYCQSNGQWSGILPSCRPVQCAIPGDPPNGRALYTSVSFNSAVKYECRYGYQLVGPLTRNCEANKQWEGTEPSCEEIDCGSPGVLHNGYLEGRTTTLGSVMIFRCFDGMKFEGVSMSTTCQQDGNWSHPLPQCLSSCIVPEVEHGRVSQVVPGARVTHGQQILVDCKPQYELVYNASPSACSNGTWTHVPVCAPARCKQLPDRPRHGMVIAPKTDHSMKALYKCKDGFKLEGDNVTECYFGRWTAPTPRCEEIYCRFPGYLTNGRVLLVGHMGMYDYRPYVRKVSNNRQIMYECNKGFLLLNGPPGATCVDGNWSPNPQNHTPQCLPGSHPHNRSARSPQHVRRPKDPCPTIPEAPWMDVQVVKFGKGNASMPHGTVVNVTCSEGYRLNIGVRRAKCVRGLWKPKQPECVTLPCVVPKGINGLLQVLDRTVSGGQSITHGDLLTVACQPGFQLVGPDSVRCWYGEWAVDAMPECLPGPCELPEITDGYYLAGYRAGLTISHGSSVDYECRMELTKLHEEAIRCEEGRLKPEPPACTARTDAVTSRDGVQETEIRIKSEEESTVTSEGFQSCSLPERLQRSVVYPAGRSGSGFMREERAVTTYPHGTEVRFRCIAGITGEKSTWRIACDDGSWVGTSHKCEDETQTAPPPEERRNKSCIFRNTEPNLVAFLGDRRVTEEVSEYPPDTELVFRCKDIGKYSLVGSVRRRCTYGEWDGVRPSCVGLSQENDYAQKPPTILFRHHLGPIAQSNDGRLIVYPGTILHLECLWLRKYGTPKWEVSHTYRKYPEGWTNEPGRDPQLEYRLSIYHAQKDDSGRFTCVSPMGHRHLVDILVVALHCSTLPQVPGLHISNSNTRMNTKVVFSCREGQTLLGNQQTTCLPSGNWSATPPECEVTECPEVTNVTDPLLAVEVKSRVVGSKAVFSCPKGFGLRGPAELICLDTGQWSADIPQCQEVICDQPAAPEKGYVQGPPADLFRGGDVVQFACNTGFMMDGVAIIVCQENGRWSAPAPLCVPACTYPGTTPGATISNVKFYYRINETVTFECAESFELRGASMLRCLEDGRWSSAIPTCHLARKG